MRTRLAALVLAGLLLAPLPVFASPERAEVEAAFSLDALLARWAQAIAGWIASGESGSDDFGPRLDPDVAIAPRGSASEAEGDLGPDVDPNGLTDPPTPPPEADLGPDVDPNG